MFNDHLNYMNQAELSETMKRCLLTLNQQFPTWGTRTPRCTPEFFQVVHRGLAEVKVTCSGAKKMLSLCVVHEGQNVFL